VAKELMMKTKQIAIVYRGDREARDTATLESGRFSGIARALKEVGLAAEPAVYDEAFADDVRARLLAVDGVLVFVNPQDSARDRTELDAMLRDIAAAGILVSAHPDVILKMGTKQVLFYTRDMSWGGDTHLYGTTQAFRDDFPLRLAEGKARVLKQHRGNGGTGVWRVATHSELDTNHDPSNAPHLEDVVFVRHAQRGSVEEAIRLGSFLDRCEPYFEKSGQLIDQVFQERLAEGMVRCYFVKDRVAGFGEQLVNALYPYPVGASRDEAPQPEQRLYYPPTRDDFQLLRRKAEEEWVPEMVRTLNLDLESLPVLWDADFLYGPKNASGEDTYVLCEINVSAVSPFPDDALELLAAEVVRRIR
jgi:hypothetical protein